jgi:hypothetical protein
MLNQTQLHLDWSFFYLATLDETVFENMCLSSIHQLATSDK